jgi:hypothetical protein
MTLVVQSLIALLAWQNGIDVESLVTRYITSAEQYQKTLQNLTAPETKTLELFRPSGELDKRREIVSDLVVYRASRDGKDVVTEYRDVRAVDGKLVKGGPERALTLLTRASKAESLEKELEAINRETFRYEFRQRHLRNLAIVQDPIPQRRRTTVRFEWRGREQIAGHAVVVVGYRDTEPSPTTQLPLPKEFGAPAFFHQGQLWLDADTGQLRRSVHEIVVRHPATSELLVLIHSEITYGPSDFGIFVPQRIVWEWMSHFSHPKNGQPSFALAERATFTYSAFKRFNVATDERIKNLPEP